MSRRADADPLVRAVREPASLSALDKQDWLVLLQRARRERLLGRLAEAAAEAGLTDRLPVSVQVHFAAARKILARNRTDIRFEIDRVAWALRDLDLPVVLLKGAAYIAAGLALARRRYCSDIDILVPRRELARAEAKLLATGWKRGEISAYDDHYYRAWMHEVPPLAHPERAVAVDLHHTIVPLTARLRPDIDALIAAARPLDGGRILVPCPADLVLHCLVHLFNEEIIFGLSDLMDLRDLLDELGTRPGFWPALIERARLHGVGRTLYYALRCVKSVAGAPVPTDAEAQTAAFAPAPPLRMVMDALFVAALVPAVPGTLQPLRAIAVWLLYIRSHWLKMPLRLLLPHLCRKAYMRWRKSATAIDGTIAAPPVQ